MTKKECCEMLARVAERLNSKAKDLSLRATIDVHTKNNLIGVLMSEAGVIQHALNELDKKGKKKSAH